MSDDTPLWLFADQLGPAVHGGEHAHREVLLVEATSALRKRRYHRQKLHLVLSALRHAERRSRRPRDPPSRRAPTPRHSNASSVPSWSTNPRRTPPRSSSHRLHQQGLVADVLPDARRSRCPATTFTSGRVTARRFRMEDFYRDQRRRFDVLMDGSDPVGNRWNYDEDNREPPPKKQSHAGAAHALPAPRGRHRRAGPPRPRPDGPRHRRRRRPAPVRRHPRRGQACADPLRRAPAARLRPLRGRHHGRRLGDVALAAVGPAQPRRAASA